MKPIILASLICIAFLFTAEAQNTNSELPQISVGYAPNLGFAQPAVIKGEGWDRAAGIDLKLVPFPGPQVVLQAFAAGQIDVMYNNVAAGLTPPTRGLAVKILSSSLKGGIFLIAQSNLSKFNVSGKAADAIRAFVAENKRKVKIATNPKGSLSDLDLRYWLDHSFDKPYDFVEVINTGSQDQLQQSILSGDVDAASAFEPLYSIAHEKNPEITILVKQSELMAEEPACVVEVTSSYGEQNPDLIKKFIALHVRATKLLRDDPVQAAKDVYNIFGKGLVTEALYEKGIRSYHDCFSSDPSEIMASTKIIHDYMRKTGYLTQDVNLDELFDLKDYNDVVNGERK